MTKIRILTVDEILDFSKNKSKIKKKSVEKKDKST